MGLTAAVALVALVWGVACGSASSGGASRVPQGELDQYLAGTVVFRFPDGSERQARVLEHRTLSPDAEVVVTETFVEGPAGLERSLHRYRLLPGHRFTLEGEPGEHDGSFEGEPWAPRAWHLRTVLPDGTIVVSDDVIDGADVTLEAPEDAATLVRRALERITRDEWEARRRAIEDGATSGE
ncbi:MAG: hypothetical protein OHK0013_15970 [Sandaracinaceae bacterium]